MANLRQDRVADPTRSQFAASAGDAPAPAGPGGNGRSATPRGIVLSIRLRTLDGSGARADVSAGADLSWDGGSPGVALVLDMIKASGGAPDPLQGAVLPARFFNLQSALLAARRIGWALQGLAESAGFSIVAELAIHSVGDPLDGSVAMALESHAQEVTPGRIMISGNLAESIQHLPGLTLRPSGQGNWRELEWRSEDTPASLAADEQSLLGLIRALGREDPLAHSIELPPPEPPRTAPVVAATGTTRGFEAPATLGRSLVEPETAPPIWKKTWIVVSAAAAVVVLAAVLVIPGMVSHSKTPAPGVPAKTTSPVTTQSAAPSMTAPTSVVAPNVPASTAPQVPAETKPGSKPGKHARTEPKSDARTEAKTETPPPQKQPAASCSLTEGEIPNSLSRAERLMYQGKLTEAQSAFQRLVGCPSARDKALEGLQRVRQRIAAQSP